MTEDVSAAAEKGAAREATTPGTVANTLLLQLQLGDPVGAGTSGVVSPLVSAIDGGTYVVKEVPFTAESETHVLREVKFHRLCSACCPGVVRYVFATTSGVKEGEERKMHVVMEACIGEVWELVTQGDGRRPSLPPTPSSFSRQGSQTLNGLERRPSASRPPMVGEGVLSWPGGSPEAALATAPMQMGRPTRAERWMWTQMLTDAVQKMHSIGFMHRDINPWNVLVAADVQKGCRCIRLADFGLGAELPFPDATLEGMESPDFTPLDASAIGSLYSAPELGDKYGFPVDVFSAGMTLIAIWFSAGLGGNGPTITNCEDRLISAVEGVKEAVKAGNAPPEDTLAELEMLGESEKALRGMILRMVAPNAPDRPTAAEVALFCDKHARMFADKSAADTSVVPRLLKALQSIDEQGSGVVPTEQLSSVVQRLSSLNPAADVEALFRASGALREDGATIKYGDFLRWLFRS